MRKTLQNIGLVAVAWSVLRGLWEIVSHVGNLQTVWDLVKDWPTIFRYAALTVSSWWFPLIISTCCLVTWLMVTKRSRAKTNKPQPILVARDELRALLREIERMNCSFEVKDASKPTLNDTHVFRLKVRACVMQDVFAGYIGPREIAKFDSPFRHQEQLAATKAKLQEYGCFDGLTPIQIAIFDIVFGLLKRTQELLAKVESGAENSRTEPDIHPLASAMDELHAIRNYADGLLSQYREKDSIKPTMDDVNALDNRIRVCVRRRGWGDKITIADRAKLESIFEFPDQYFMVAAEFQDAGLLDNLTGDEQGVFNWIAHKTEQLKELISKLESEK